MQKLFFLQLKQGKRDIKRDKEKPALSPATARDGSTSKDKMKTDYIQINFEEQKSKTTDITLNQNFAKIKNTIVEIISETLPRILTGAATHALIAAIL